MHLHTHVRTIGLHQPLRRRGGGGGITMMTTAASSALPETPLAKPFTEVAQARFSNGHYKEHQPVPQHVLNDILRLTQRAPSSFNIQPYSLIVVRDPAVRARLAKEAMLGRSVGRSVRAFVTQQRHHPVT